MNYLKLLVSRERAKQLSEEFGLKIYEPQENFFIASESDIEKFRQSYCFVCLDTEEIKTEVTNDDEAAHGRDETRAADSTNDVDDLDTRDLFDCLGLDSDLILAFQKRFSDFPVSGSNGIFSAKHDELRSWMQRNPGVLNWSDLHFRYDGQAI